MLYFVWFLSLIGAFYFGYQCKRIIEKVDDLEKVVKKKIDKPEEETPQSEIIDLLDPVAEAQYEHSKMMERLNGKS